MKDAVEEEFKWEVRGFVSGCFWEWREEDWGREDGEAFSPEPEGKCEEEGHA